jgi:nitroimidazol reductase NimA-like FMN-containing flavoprotein (pyridoxamine 5'-phosphate oxidase superfamily)
MFREMRRKKQLLPLEETINVLDRGTSGVLALSGDNGYPYAVPLSYIYCDGRLYFHCAKSGHKLDALLANPKASFCVIDMDDVIPEEYTTYFRSVIVFGTLRILEDEGEKRRAIEKLAAKYSPAHKEGRLKEIDREFKMLCMLEMSIEHMTGKEAIELVKQRG